MPTQAESAPAIVFVVAQPGGSAQRSVIGHSKSVLHGTGVALGQPASPGQQNDGQHESVMTPVNTGFAHMGTGQGLAVCVHEPAQV